MKHTPTPWEIHDENNVAGVYGPDESDWGVIADCNATWSSVPDEQREANAAFIVKAVNSYDKAPPPFPAESRDFDSMIEWMKSYEEWYGQR